MKVRRGPASRERILDAALDLFLEVGFERTSVRQIAARVGMNKASLYYHFASKEDIFADLARRVYGIGHYLGLDQLLPDGADLDIPALAAKLEYLLDQILANRRVVSMLERNRATWRSLGEVDPTHSDRHRLLEERWNQFMVNPEVPIRIRVRLGAALGALLGGAVGVSPGLGPVSGGAGGQEERDELVLVLRQILTGALIVCGNYS